MTELRQTGAALRDRTQTQALLLQLDAACRAADELAEATSEVFHPASAIRRQTRR